MNPKQQKNNTKDTRPKSQNTLKEFNKPKHPEPETQNFADPL